MLFHLSLSLSLSLALQLSLSATPVVVLDEEEEEEERAFQEQIQQWRKAGDTAAKPKYVYKSLDELKDAGPLSGRGRERGKEGVFGPETRVKVIDLTGREARVMSSYKEMRQSRVGEISTVGKTPLLISLNDYAQLSNDNVIHYFFQ